MSKVVELPDHLYQTLEIYAQTSGVTPEDLLARLVEEHYPPPSSSTEDVSLHDVRQATRALLYGDEPPCPVDWNELDHVRDTTEPFFATLEEAMSWARGYPWTVSHHHGADRF